MDQEEKEKLLPIRYEQNECAGCGKVFQQALIATQFGIIMQKFCDSCVDKYDRKEKAIQKQQEENRLNEWLQKIGIKEAYYPATLDNYETVTESQTEALSACKEMLNGKLNKLVLLGGNGVGKTHLASALVKRMNGRLVSAYEMFAYYRSCFSGQHSELKILKEFSSYPLLAIDEFGRTKGSEAEENFLSVIIDNRHSANLPTIILSNLIRKRDCVFFNPNNPAKCQECERKSCLESRLTKDIISRLRENSHVILMEGPDYRRNKNDR